jgi:hypothetical protein
VTWSSYTGRGNVDEVDGFLVKREWIEADDQKAVIQAACRDERQARDSRALVQARREAQAAQGRLQALEGNHG